MTTMNVTRFKTHCLSILEQMRDTPEELVLTKHGKVIAKVVPVCGVTEGPWEELLGTAHFAPEDLMAEEDIWEDL